MKKNQGFTLLELLIVIGMIAILGSVIYIAVDPGRRFGQARNAQRWASVNSILNAVLNFASDNQGTLPANLQNVAIDTNFVLGTGGVNNCLEADCPVVVNSNNCLDLTSDLVDRYIASIPIDSLKGTAANTHYYIRKTPTGRILVGACDAELGEVIINSR